MFVCGAEEQILHDLLCQGLFSAAFFRDNKLSVERRPEPVARGGTMWPWVIGAIAVGIGLTILALLWRPLRAFGREVRVERARELFRLQRERLEAQFHKAAAATGKPRGLRWKDCQWENGVEFVRERKTGQIAALVGVTIQFEAVEGGDMEGLPAVGNLRN